MTPPTPVDLEYIKDFVDYLFNRSDAKELLNTEEELLWSETSALGDMFSQEIVELILMARENVPAMITELEHLRNRVKELEDGRDKNTSLDGDLCRRYR